MTNETMDNWELKMIPYATTDLERKVLSEGPSSFAGSLCFGMLKAKYMKMHGIVETSKDSYNADWKMEYIQLKGWENMSDGEKYLCTHHISSSAEGMGNVRLKEELKAMKETKETPND